LGNWNSISIFSFLHDVTHAAFKSAEKSTDDKNAPKCESANGNPPPPSKMEKQKRNMAALIPHHFQCTEKSRFKYALGRLYAIREKKIWFTDIGV
jgi:hypothetical protein